MGDPEALPTDTAALEEGDHHAIGDSIRTLRKLEQKTLKQVAAETGLSIGYLSQVERNQSSPSVKALHAISRAFGVNITWFFDDGDGGSAREYIVRRDERKELRFESGISDFLLSQRKGAELELLWCRFEPGATSGDEPYTHAGEEAGVVVSGEFAIMIDDRWNILGPGDSFAFPSNLPHKYMNPGRRVAEVVWAITPPTY